MRLMRDRQENVLIAAFAGGGSAGLGAGDRAQERRRGAEAYGGPARNQNDLPRSRVADPPARADPLDEGAEISEVDTAAGAEVAGHRLEGEGEELAGLALGKEEPRGDGFGELAEVH